MVQMMSQSLRSRQSAKRRMTILEAAESLIRETGGTDFSVRRLAERAEVSPVTPYNIFGSKRSLLYSLLLLSLENSIEKWPRFDRNDPELHVIRVTETAVKLYVDDALFLRPLYKELLGASDPVHRPHFMQTTYKYWHSAARSIPGIRERWDPDMIARLARTLMASFNGELEQWLQHDHDAEVFRRQSVNNVILICHSAFNEADLQKALARLS